MPIVPGAPTAGATNLAIALQSGAGMNRGTWGQTRLLRSAEQERERAIMYDFLERRRQRMAERKAKHQARKARETQLYATAGGIAVGALAPFAMAGLGAAGGAVAGVGHGVAAGASAGPSLTSVLMGASVGGQVGSGIARAATGDASGLADAADSLADSYFNSQRLKQTNAETRKRGNAAAADDSESGGAIEKIPGTTERTDSARPVGLLPDETVRRRLMPRIDRMIPNPLFDGAMA